MPLENGNGGGVSVQMPVQPMYGGGYPVMNGGFGGFGNGLFGGDGSWLLLLILLCGGGWGGFGMGGWGGMMGMDMMGGFGLYPWLNNSQNINSGFRDQMTHDAITSIGDRVTSGFGDVQTALCGGFGGVNQNISSTGAAIQNTLCQGFAGTTAAVTGAQNAIAQQMYANQIADLNRSFDAQTATTAGMTNIAQNLQNCCCENRAGIADLKYTVATENCADRTAAAQNTRDIIDSQTRGTQAILDKLCALELDGVKGQLATAQRENIALQNALNMATMRESQTAQTAAILQGQNAEVDALYNRLSNCPVPSTPVYGRTPIFTCNNGCGRGGNAFAA